MEPRDVAEVARLVGGELFSGEPGTRVGPDVVIDTRKTTPRSLFVALPGERVDGHDFTDAAAAGGAAAVLVTRPTTTSAAQIIVEDGIAALSRLAHQVVTEARVVGACTIALTGSSGKTSTKDVLAQLLEAHAPTVSPVGSFNNEIGVPLTACRLGPDDRFLVSEMGTRGAGHLAWLCSIVPPDVSLVLNVGTAHLGEFGSVEGIALAKGELVEALEPGGWAVLNLDDPRVWAMRGRAVPGVRVAAFTLEAGARRPEDVELLVRAHDLHPDDAQRYSFTLEASDAEQARSARVTLPLLGRHQVANAAAACATALAVGVPFDQVVDTLGRLQHRSAWRMELQERADGLVVINDTYNANPDSMRAALTTLAEVGATRQRARPGARMVAIVGDMLELGGAAQQLHRDLGAQAAALGIDVYAIGEHAADVVAGARSAGEAPTRAVELTLEQASSLSLAKDDVVLVKASRGLALDRVAEALLSPAPTSLAPTGGEPSPAKDSPLSLTDSSAPARGSARP